MLTYYEPKKDKNGYVYSVDMVRMTFTLPSNDQARQHIADYFSRDGRTDIEIYPPSTKNLKYRNLVTVDYGLTTSTYGFGFNGPNKDDILRGFVEFNPNKTMNGNADQFKQDLAFLSMNVIGLDIARYDLAIDVPITRQNLVLSNPRGKCYRLERYSSENKTEWLGRRNTHGYTKLYNKALESKIDQDGVMLHDLTRIELTLETDDMNEITKELPVVTRTGEADLQELNKTNRLLVILLREKSNPTVYLEQLDYRSREKIKPYVFGDVRLEYDTLCIAETCKGVNSWLDTSISVKPKDVKDDWIHVDLSRTPFTE